MNSKNLLPIAFVALLALVVIITLVGLLTARKPPILRKTESM